MGIPGLFPNSLNTAWSLVATLMNPAPVWSSAVLILMVIIYPVIKEKILIFSKTNIYMYDFYFPAKLKTSICVYLCIAEGRACVQCVG